MAPTDRLRVAVIGGGNIAQQHLPVLADLPGVELVALADVNPRTRNDTADRFGIPNRRYSHAEILDQDRPDAVFVLVSVLQVADVAAACIQSGVPTFLEKPPGLHTSQTRRLADLAETHGTLSAVGVNRRFYSTQLRARDLLLESGPPGSITVEAHEDVTRVRNNPKFPETVLRRWSAANGIHALDLLRFFGGDISEIQTLHHTVEGPMPDCCSALLKFERGGIGRALMDWFSPGGHRYELRTRDLTLTSSPGFGRIHVRRRGVPETLLEPDEIDRRYKAGFYNQDRTFLESVRSGAPLPFPACTLPDAVKTMEMIDTISGTGD